MWNFYSRCSIFLLTDQTVSYGSEWQVVPAGSLVNSTSRKCSAIENPAQLSALSTEVGGLEHAVREGSRNWEIKL